MTTKHLSYLCSSVFIGGSIFLVGCETTSETESQTRKQQQSALNDPFQYGPNAQTMQKPQDNDVDPTDITGGGTANLNKKALKRDWDAVLGR